MSLKDHVTTVRLDRELADAVARVQEQYGTPVAEQIRRGLRMWLETQGVLKADRQRGATRRRP